MQWKFLGLFAFIGLCQAEEWRSLFNGKDLEGWSGDPRIWRVEQGCIVGETDAAGRAIQANSFLIREDIEPGDFVLEFKARVTGQNNSGVQYRSQRPEPDGWVLKGYQLDLHPKAEYLGMLYEERGRGISCKRGEIVTLGKKPKVTGALELDEVKLEEWNTYRIEARGNELTHYVNGKPAAKIRDVSKMLRSERGFIGLQVHVGPPMKAEFKAIRWMPVADTSAEDMTGSVKLPPDFKLERVYQVPKQQGSWVSMTMRPDGGFYCSDQYGEIYKVRMTKGRTEVLPATFQLRGAHGLLWHQGVLWVSVNEGINESGVWKVIDTDGDGEPDKPELVKSIRGRGEHGIHSLVASPDGRSIFLVSGNHSDVPEFDSSLVPQVWQEDQLLERRPDGRGHAAGRLAPGGWIARFKPDGSRWQLFAMGFRNPFDLAFNEHGDAFTFDSDMEWDLGMPWYRPTRICHVTPGAEFGWRNGTGKWPAAYEDSMPPQLEIGPGSPTGMVSGRGAKFPAAYQRALFSFDWTFATIYAIHLAPDGMGYKATREDFLAGSGMPLTDGLIGPDGALYFLTGGRRSGSALWRVSYTGSESTEPVPYQDKELVHVPAASALAGLGSPDRITRHQSRVSLELEGAGTLERALLSATEPWQVITASIGLARVGSAGQSVTILKALETLDWSRMDVAQQVNWLRAVGLVFTRHGKPDEAIRTRMLAKIDSAFPSKNELLDRELCRMLCYLGAPGIVTRTLFLMDSSGPGAPPDWLELARRNERYGKTVEAMIGNPPPAQVIHYIYCLRTVKGPWQKDERRRFFDWFPRLLERSGGASYAAFLMDLRDQALKGATHKEREWLEKLIEAPAPESALVNLPRPKGPGKAWTTEDVERIAAAGYEGADRENGRAMYQATLCVACHRFGGEGGAVGPDLSTVSGRFNATDLANAILDPSAIISDQYEFTEITRTDGSTVLGKLIMEEEDGDAVLAPNPFDLSQTVSIPVNSIAGKKPSPVSPMPPNLIHSLNEQELRDLLAYLLAR